MINESDEEEMLAEEGGQERGEHQMAVRGDTDMRSRLRETKVELWTAGGGGMILQVAGGRGSLPSLCISSLVTSHQGGWMGTFWPLLLFVFLLGRKHCDFSTLLYPGYALLLL